MPKHRFDITRLADMFSALSNPNRLRMFARMMVLCRPGEVCCADPQEMRRCVGELGEDLGLAQSTVSHHLKALRQAGLIHMERRGKTVECWVDSNAVAAVMTFLQQPLPRTDMETT